ncbi:MAG: MFS transporter, partial [Acidimicrobiales bacterium]|nr:MFS transporter [Acidimicrobiales bacterium]
MAASLRSPSSSGEHRSERATIVFVAFLAVIMAFGVEAVLPAFTEIDEEFGFTDRGLSVSLLVTALLVGMACGQFLWGPLSDRIGRRPALFAGIGLYALGAIGTALAPSLPLLLAARIVWGLGAAAPNGLRLAV